VIATVDATLVVSFGADVLEVESGEVEVDAVPDETVDPVVGAEVVTGMRVDAPIVVVGDVDADEVVVVIESEEEVDTEVEAEVEAVAEVEVGAVVVDAAVEVDADVDVVVVVLG